MNESAQLRAARLAYRTAVVQQRTARTELLSTVVGLASSVFVFCAAVIAAAAAVAVAVIG